MHCWTWATIFPSPTKGGKAMIEKTFSILPGIGPETERRLWEEGILTWPDFLERPSVPHIPPFRKPLLDAELERWLKALEERDAPFFFRHLPQKEHWRLFPAFREEALYFDIETTGLSPYLSLVTVVGLYEGRRYIALVRDIDLHPEVLYDYFDSAKLFVSFFGARFDIPFLRRHFPALPLERPHFDLCLSGRRVGLKGGLKRVERALGIKRDPEIEDMDGTDALLLWLSYERTGDKRALELLLRYNEADVCNLELLAEEVYRRLSEKFGPPGSRVNQGKKCRLMPEEANAPP